MKLLQPAHTHTTHVKASNLINAALFLPLPHPHRNEIDRVDSASLAHVFQFSFFTYTLSNDDDEKVPLDRVLSTSKNWNEMSSYTNSIASIFLQGPGWSIFFRNFFYLIGLRRRAEVMLECEKCCLYDTSTWGRRLSGRQQGGDEVKLKSMLNAGQDSWVSPDFHLISLPASAVCRRKLNFNRKFI